MVFLCQLDLKKMIVFFKWEQPSFCRYSLVCCLLDSVSALLLLQQLSSSLTTDNNT